MTRTDTGSGITKTFTYDTNTSELTSLQTTGSSSQSLTFGYNANGDRISQSGGTNPITYGYNQADQLTSDSQGSTTASYAYDGNGLRTSKTVNGSSEGYVWNITEGMPTILQDGSTRYLTGPGGLPIE